MDDFEKQVKQKLGKNTPPWRQMIGVFFFAVLGLSLPVTIFLTSQEQDIRQEAAKPKNVTPTPSICAKPTITIHTDTNKKRGGTVSFSWRSVPGATQYTIQRQNGNSWTTISTTSSRNFLGLDANNDPNWRIYVSSGTCKPIPGPATILDPYDLKNLN